MPELRPHWPNHILGSRFIISVWVCIQLWGLCITGPVYANSGLKCAELNFSPNQNANTKQVAHDLAVMKFHFTNDQRFHDDSLFREQMLEKFKHEMTLMLNREGEEFLQIFNSELAKLEAEATQSKIQNRQQQRTKAEQDNRRKEPLRITAEPTTPIHTGEFRTKFYWPEKNYLYLASNSQKLLAYDLNTMQQLFTPIAQTHNFDFISILPNQQLLAIADNDVGVYNAITGKLDYTFKHQERNALTNSASTAVVNHIDISKDSRYLLTGSYNLLKVTDLKKRELAYRFEYSLYNDRVGKIQLITPDGRYLVFTTAKYLRIFDLRKNEVVHEIPNTNSEMNFVNVISENSKQLVFAKDKSLIIINWTSGKIIREIALKEINVRYRFSSDDQYVYVLDDDLTGNKASVQVIEIATGKTIFYVEKQIDSFSGLMQIFRHGTLLIIRYRNTHIEVVDLHDQRVLLPLRHFKSQPVPKLSPDGKFLALGNYEGDSLIEVDGGWSHFDLTPHPEGSYSRAAFSSDGRFVAFASTRGMLRLFNIETNEVFLDTDLGACPTDFFISSDNKQIIVELNRTGFLRIDIMPKLNGH